MPINTVFLSENIQSIIISFGFPHLALNKWVLSQEGLHTYNYEHEVFIPVLLKQEYVYIC